jgi:hypothetical protein
VGGSARRVHLPHRRARHEPRRERPRDHAEPAPVHGRRSALQGRGLRRRLDPLHRLPRRRADARGALAAALRRRERVPAGAAPAEVDACAAMRSGG